MNYELAKKLKDAGFPQRNNVAGDDLEAQIKYGFPIYGCVHGNKCKTSPIYCETTVYYPMLGELIVACGKDLYSIQFSENIPGTRCYVISSLPGAHPPVFSSKTPEEAVANLWLELNK